MSCVVVAALEYAEQIWVIARKGTEEANEVWFIIDLITKVNKAALCK